MRVLFDSNVILDAVLTREPFAEEAARLWRAVETGKVAGTIASFSFATIYYVCRKKLPKERTRAIVAACIGTFDIAPVAQWQVIEAIQMPQDDFEDSMQTTVAMDDAVAAIVTRDSNGFATCPLPVYTPADLLH